MSSDHEKAANLGAHTGGRTSDFQDAIPENVEQSSAVKSGTLPDTGNLLDKQGGIGRQFKADGTIGSTAQQVGGVFDKHGDVGKQFTQSGLIGGTVQETVGGGESVTDKAEEAMTSGTSLFDKKPVIKDGAIGNKGVEIGNPFGKDGVIGKIFNSDGSVGETAQTAEEKAGETAKTAQEKLGETAQMAQEKLGETTSSIADQAKGAFGGEGQKSSITDQVKEDTGPNVPGQKEGIFEKSVFDKTGAVGKQFEADGAAGATAQSLGGPFDKEGAIGKQFTTEGSIGATAQKALGDRK